jgi:hypothetical protein
MLRMHVCALLCCACMRALRSAVHACVLFALLRCYPFDGWLASHSPTLLPSGDQPITRGCFCFRCPSGSPVASLLVL